MLLGVKGGYNSSLLECNGCGCQTISLIISNPA